MSVPAGMESAEFRHILEVLSDSDVSASVKTEQLHLLSTLLADPLAGSSVAEAVPLATLFSCVSTNNKDLTSACCSVLGKLLPMLDMAKFFQSLAEQLGPGLSHPVEDVRQVCLRQLLRCVDNEQLCVSLLEAHNGGHVTKCLKDTSLSCAMLAADLLAEAARRYESCAQLLLSSGSAHCQEFISILAGKEDVLRYRVFAMVADISTHSPGLLRMCTESGLLSRLVADLDKDDVLVKMNCLEALHVLAKCDHGLAYLEDSGALGKIAQLLTSSDDPFSQLVLPGERATLPVLHSSYVMLSS